MRMGTGWAVGAGHPDRQLASAEVARQRHLARHRAGAASGRRVDGAKGGAAGALVVGGSAGRQPPRRPELQADRRRADARRRAHRGGRRHRRRDLRGGGGARAALRPRRDRARSRAGRRPARRRRRRGASSPDTGARWPPTRRHRRGRAGRRSGACRLGCRGRRLHVGQRARDERTASDPSAVSVFELRRGDCLNGLDERAEIRRSRPSPASGPTRRRCWPTSGAGRRLPRPGRVTAEAERRCGARLVAASPPRRNGPVPSSSPNAADLGAGRPDDHLHRDLRGADARHAQGAPSPMTARSASPADA